MNSITATGMLSPEDSKRAFAAGEHELLRYSTIRKVDSIETILQLLADGRLKTSPESDIEPAAGEPTDPVKPRNRTEEHLPPATKSEQRAKWLATAMLLVRDHPGWSDAEIARRVGIDRSTLSRSQEYQVAAAMARGDKTVRPKGHIKVDVETGSQDVEAYTDDDPAKMNWDD